MRTGKHGKAAPTRRKKAVKEAGSSLWRRALCCLTALSLVVLLTPSIVLADDDAAPGEEEPPQVSFSTSAPALLHEEDADDPDASVHYFDNNVTVTASIPEGSYVAELVDAEGGSNEQGWVLDEKAGSYQYEAAFSAEGSASLVVTVREGVDDQTGTKYSYRLVIDKTAPTVSIAPSKESTSKKGQTTYYPAGTSFSVAASDDNLDAGKRVVTLDGEELEGLDWEDGEATVTVEDDYVTHVLGISAEDKAKHSSEQSLRFAIDGNEPAISYWFTKDAVRTEDGVAYYDAPLTVRASVASEHFEAEGSYLAVGQGQSTEWTQDPDDESGQTWYAEYAIVSDGSYQLSVCAQMESGRTVTKAYASDIVVDSAAPTVAVSFDIAPVVAADSASGIDYFDERPTATVTVSDANLDADTTTLNGAAAQWTKTDGGYRAVVGLEDGVGQALAVEAKDLAGHTTSYHYGQNDDFGSTVAKEQTLQGASYTVNSSDPQIGFTVGDAGSSVFDPSIFTQFFGVERVSLTVEVADLDLDLDNTHVYLVGKDGASTEQTPSWQQTSSGWRAEVDGLVSIGEYRVEVVATNTSKRSATYYYKHGSDEAESTTIVADAVAPKVAVSFDEAASSHSGEGNADYFGVEKVTATVSVEDEYFDAGSTHVYLEKNGVRSEVPVSDWSYEGEDAAGVKRHTAIVAEDEFTASGQQSKYSIEVAAADKAGNKTGYAYGDNDDAGFKSTVDKEGTKLKSKSFVVYCFDPDVSVTLDRAPSKAAGSGQDAPDVFDDTVTASILVSSEYFDPAGSTVNGKAVEWAVDGSTYSTQVVYGEGVGQKLTVHAVNLAGHGADYSYGDNASGSEVFGGGISTLGPDGAQLRGSALTIDKTSPDVAVELGKRSVRTYGQVDYFQEALVASLTVTDWGFDPDASKVSGHGATWSGTWVSGPDAKDGTPTWTTSVEYGEGRENALSLTATDEAGNTAAYSYGANGKAQDARDAGGALSTEDAAGAELSGSSFTIDETSPDVAVVLSEKTTASFGDADYFDNSTTGAKSLTATVSVTDVEFETAVCSVTGTGATWSGSWVRSKTAGNAIVWTTTVSYPEGTGRTLSLTASDIAGNKASYSYGANGRAQDARDAGGSLSTADASGSELSGTAFTIDITAPTVSSAKTSRKRVNDYKDGKLQFWNKNVTLAVTVLDNIGLRSATLGEEDAHYHVANDVTAGSAKQEIKVSFEDGYEFDRAIILDTSDIAGNTRTWSIAPNGTVTDVTGSSKKNTSLSDEGVYPTTLVKDTVNPKLELSGAKKGEFYTGSRKVVLDVDELNFGYVKSYDPEQVVITIDKTAGNSGAKKSSRTVPASDFASAKGGGTGKYTHSVTLRADGHYRVRAKVVDPAQNSTSATIGTFTIDNTAPTVQVSFDNNDVRNGKYYDSSRTATIVVTEHNFDPSLIRIATTGSVGTWSTEGDVHTTTVSFAADGEHNLTVSGTDQAGNELSTYKADEFVVDTAAPTIEFSGVENESAYNDVVEPAILFSDEANFSRDNAEYTMTGTKNGAVSYSNTAQAESDGETVSFADFGRTAAYDDIYTIDASLQDLAGNSATGSITFSVNRFGSNFRVVNASDYTDNDGYLANAQDVVFEEINVSGCAKKQHGVSVTRDVETEKLEPSAQGGATGYSIDADTSTDRDSKGWSVYTYTVLSGNFSQDGNYHISVDSTDKATNTNDSSEYYDRAEGKLEDASVNFILDTTDPVINGLTIENGTTYDSSSLEGSFTVAENIGVKDVTATLDGQTVDLEQGANDSYSFEVPARAFTPRSFQVTATDYAGRQGSADIEGFHVTTNVIELHLPLVIVACLLVLAVVLALVWWLKRRRKEQGNAQE